MKKKIIFVTKALWIGGIETALVNLLKYLDYDRYDVTLLVLKAELDMLDQIHPKCRVLIADREKQVAFSEKYRYQRLYHFTEEAANPSAIHRALMWTVPLIRWIENRLYIRYIRRQMRNETFDTAVIYSDVAGETAVRAIKADRYLMFYHHGAMRHVYHDAVAYRRCDKIIAVSENLAEKLRKFIPEYSYKVTAVHNLTDVETIRKKAAEPIPEHFDSSKFHIVSVGRVSHEKGMDLAVRVCAKLIDDGYDSVRWWIVGDGPAMRKVRMLIKELHMEEYIFPVGMKSNPYPYILQADLYVQPSRVEAFGLAIIEAMILGRMVISTCTAGAGNIIENGKTGVLCSVDMNEMATQIEWVIRNPERIRKLQKAVQMIEFEEKNRECISRFEELL